MQINIKERLDVNQDGPVWLLKLPPPPPPGPQIAKDVNVCHIIIYCFSLLYLCLQCDEDFMTDTFKTLGLT